MDKILTLTQRAYIEELNQMFNHNWETNLKSVLIEGKYNRTQQLVINDFKEVYLKYKNETLGGTIKRTIYIKPPNH